MCHLLTKSSQVWCHVNYLFTLLLNDLLPYLAVARSRVDGAEEIPRLYVVEKVAEVGKYDCRFEGEKAQGRISFRYRPLCASRSKSSTQRTRTYICERDPVIPVPTRLRHLPARVATLPHWPSMELSGSKTMEETEALRKKTEELFNAGTSVLGRKIAFSKKLADHLNKELEGIIDKDEKAPVAEVELSAVAYVSKVWDFQVPVACVCDLSSKNCTWYMEW